MNEFELISGFRRIFEQAVPTPARSLFPVANGDDAAVVRPPSGMATMTTDALVEGVHFSFNLCSHEDAGYRSIAVNLSDLAAMGAAPLGVLVSLVIPDRMTDDSLFGVARGIADAASRFACPVVGGNITRTDGPFVISITAVGDQLASPVPLRTGAVEGDGIWVSGHIGSGALGLRLLLERPDLESEFPGLVAAWRRPVPRLDLVGLFCETTVHSSIDVSDGLVADVAHIAGDSGLSAQIDVDAVPVSGEAREFCRAAGIDDWISPVLTGGDDYQLVIVAPVGSDVALRDAGLTRVGTMQAGSGVHFVNAPGNFPAQTGWLHRRG